MEHTFSWLSQSHRMSKDNDGLCATAEAFVYVAMTRSMVFFRAFHAAIAYVWCALSGRRRRLVHIAAATLIGESIANQRQRRRFPARRTARTSWRPRPAVRASSLAACRKTGGTDACHHHLQYVTPRQFLQTVHSRSGCEESWTLDLRHAKEDRGKPVEPTSGLEPLMAETTRDLDPCRLDEV
jgi:hypothetical protein